MRNMAASKKELKAIEEVERKAELAATRTPVQMHKRPKELSVNHAAATVTDNAQPAVSGGAAAAAAVAVGGTVSRDANANRPASPFKKVEGAAPAPAKPEAPFKTATQQNANGAIMTSAFKPSTGAHNPSDKIVSSAFKPSTGTHNPSDKIVSSAFKQSQKFTPQKGPDTAVAATAVHSDNEAVKLARERAEAAREQQAMREAMKAQKTAAAAPAKQHAPVKRPSAFSVNHAAVVAAQNAEAEKPAANKAPSVPAAPAAPKASGASLGVGASAAAPKNGPVISPSRAKASSNSNQLGNLLNGKANNSGRAPVWAAPGTAGISPFKQSAQAQEEVKAEAAKEEMNTAVEAEAPQTSYADQAKTHKSAFFSRSSASKDSQSSIGGSSNAYGGIVRPTGVISDKERQQQVQNAAMGSVLEGQKPAILDPSSHVAPTAVEPISGFKPIDPQN